MPVSRQPGPMVQPGLIVLSLLLASLVGCGQTGPLSLREAAAPAEPEAPNASEAQAPDSDDDER